MKLLNLQVISKKFGKGIIVKEDFGENHVITIDFATCQKRFSYPEAFANGYLYCENVDLEQAKIDLEEKNITEQKKKEAEKIQIEQNVLLAIKNEKPKRDKSDRENVAFKCQYCDGGKNENRVGFNGICSKTTMEYNTLMKDTGWCNNGSKCMQYVLGMVNYEELESEYAKCQLCYESVMLNKWWAKAGITQNGERKGNPMKMHKVKENSLAVLTTRYPGNEEYTRFVFAVFLVNRLYAGDEFEAGYVQSDSKWRIELTPSEAEKISFWKYYYNKNKPEKIVFGSGLHRYLSDMQSAQILLDIVNVKEKPEEKAFAQEFLEEYCKRVNLDINDIKPCDGAIIKVLENK